MIYYLSKDTVCDFLKFKIECPFRCKIVSLFNLYFNIGMFSGFWIQYNESNHVTSIICKFYATLIICAESNADFEELKSFIKNIGAECVLCGKNVACYFNDKFRDYGYIMKYSSSIIRYPELGCELKSITEIKPIYDFLNSEPDSGFSNVDFESFYVDVSHRIRHNGSRIKGIYEYEKLVSCAFTTYETSNCAIIGAVLVKSEYRNMGYGSKTVQKFIEILLRENKQVYIFREKNKNEQFYKKIGFKNYDKWFEFNTGDL